MSTETIEEEINDAGKAEIPCDPYENNFILYYFIFNSILKVILRGGLWGKVNDYSG